MVGLFVDNLLPVLLVSAVGWLLAAGLKVDARPLNHAAFYLFAPCLVFRILIESRINGGELARVIGFTVAALGIPALAGFVLARLRGWSRTRTAALVLVVLLPNAGNLGLPATRFAFGDDALARAGVFFVTASLMTYTVGVLVASLGRSGWVRALLRLPRVPAIWAVAAAVALRSTGGAVPVPVDRAIGLLADATIPTLLVLLGMQLHGRGIRGSLPSIAGGAALRLVGGATCGWLLAAPFGLEGAARQGAVLEAAMPSAVVTIVLAAEFDVEPSWVTSVVVATTILCPLTLTPLMALLGA